MKIALGQTATLARGTTPPVESGAAPATSFKSQLDAVKRIKIPSIKPSQPSSAMVGGSSSAPHAPAPPIADAVPPAQAGGEAAAADGSPEGTGDGTKLAATAQLATAIDARAAAAVASLATPSTTAVPGASAGKAPSSTPTAPPPTSDGTETSNERERDAPLTPLTPLEQAIHELVTATRDSSAPHSDAETSNDAVAASAQPTDGAATSLLAREHAAVASPASNEPAPTAAAPAIAAISHAQQVENTLAVANASSSHVHLVLDDGAGRVVVTVAVRGNDVNVALRASDDHTAAALSRNAGALDHAMRGRGLTLAQLDAEREPSREPSRERDRADRQRSAPQPQTDEPFVLEETP